MISLDEAKQIAEKHLAELQLASTVSIVFDYGQTEETENGYVFFYNTPEFWKTGDPSYTLDGNEPIFVSKNDGQLKEITFQQFLAYENGDKSAIN
jgi:hypothetical protein